MTNVTRAADVRAQSDELAATLQQAFIAGADVLQLQQQRTEFFDRLIRQLVGDFFSAETDGVRESLACVAIGGYGRQELAPGSDLDLLFLSGDARGEACAKHLLYRLWDMGLQVTGVVRTMDSCAEQLRSGELRTQTALLDSRWIGGADSLWHGWQRVQQRVQRSRRWQRRFVQAKLDEQQLRRARCGATPFFLEPNVKEGEGGLRDWQTLWWIGCACGHVASPADFVQRGWMIATEWVELTTAVQWMHRIRWGLHALAGRKQDRLGFEEQEVLASTLQPVQAPHERSPAATLMRYYYASASTIRDHCEELLWRWQSEAPQRAVHHLRQRLSRRVWFRHGDSLAVVPTRVHGVQDVVQIFAALAVTQCRLDPASRSALRRLERALSESPHGTLAWHPFASPDTTARVLREMQRTGWLERFFPEFRPLRCLAQRDAYHCYTVDTHLIEAVAQCASILAAPANELPPGLVQARARIPHPDDLLFATFYHDVGKGVGRSHAHTGARLIERAAGRWNWDPQRIGTMQFLVRAHQLMSSLAFTRDLHDERLIEQFAETVETTEQLAQLYLLTVADLRAVGPTVYTEWKRSLLDDLYTRAEACLTRGGRTTAAIAELRERMVREVEQAHVPDYCRAMCAHWIDAMPERYLRTTTPREIGQHIELWYSHGERPVSFTAVMESQTTIRFDFLAADQPGLFAKLCGVLAAHGYNIHEAQVCTGSHGYVIDRFRCAARGGLTARAQRDMLRELADVVGAHHSVETLLARRRGGLLRRRSRVPVDPQIAVDTAISEEYTVLDIRTTDRLGLLYDMANALYLQGFDIMTAKIATTGGQVHDAFYVQDAEGGKVTDAARLAELTAALRQVLGA